jgi:hypothetical protein
MVLYILTLYSPREQAGRQKTLDRMVASISRIYSALKLFLHATSWECVALNFMFFFFYGR